MPVLFQVLRPGRSPSSETVSVRPKAATPTIERPVLVMNPSDLRGETVALSKLTMPRPPPRVYDPAYDAPIYDPYYDDPNYGNTPPRQQTATTPGRQTPSIQSRVDQGMSLVQGADGMMYLIGAQDKTASGVIRSVGQVYGAANTVSGFLGNQSLSGAFRSAGPYAGMALGAAALVTGQGWNSVSGAAGNINTGFQLAHNGSKVFTSGGISALGSATQVIGGFAGGIAAFQGARQIGGILMNGQFTAGTMLQAGLATYGVVGGVYAAATMAAGFGLAGAAPIAGAFAASGFGLPIAAGIMATVAVVTAWRSRKVNQENKVDDGVLTEILKNGVENLGHEKYRTDDKWKDTFKVTDEFAKILSSRDEKGEPKFKDANGNAYTMESFKNAPPEERRTIRAAVGNALAAKIDSGGMDSNPNASKEEKDKERGTMLMIACAMMSSTRDSKEIYFKAMDQAPPAQRQALFNEYVEVTTKASREVIGDPHPGPGSPPATKDGAVQSMMKRVESTKTQWDWMQVEFAQKAAELGVQFAGDWATPPVDQKKYQELKKKESKKGFDKLEGGDKLDIKKYELAQQSQGQPRRFGWDKVPTTVQQQMVPNPYGQQMQIDPYAPYVQGQQYSGSQPQRVRTTPKITGF